MSKPRPITFNLYDDEIACLDTLAAQRAQAGRTKVNRSAIVRELLKPLLPAAPESK
jgi:hypothetical protein